MSSFVSNALLHLLFQLNSSPRHVPLSSRNDILSKYMKERYKKKEYKRIKQDIHRLILLKKSPRGNIEEHLWRLNDILVKQAREFTDADRLHLLLQHLNERFEIQSHLGDEEAPIEDNVIYIEKEEINDSFDQDNNQVKNIRFSFVSNEPSSILNKIKSYNNGEFIAEIIGKNVNSPHFELKRTC